MSTEVTTEMNSTIAIFEGWKLINGDPTTVCPSCDEGKVPSGWCICDQKADRFLKDGKMVSLKYFQYHTSWDWLMPVVKKIKGMHLDILQQAFVMDYMKAAAHMNSGLLSLNIEEAHLGVYKFLTWYNQQKQNNEQ